MPSHATTVVSQASAPKRDVHSAHLYINPNTLSEAVATFAEAAIWRGYAQVIVATRNHMELFVERLSEKGHNCGVLRESGQLTFLDAQSCLDAMMDDRTPNERAFNGIVGGLIDHSLSRFPGLAVYGELVNLLVHQGNKDAAHQLELWWNRLIEKHHFSLLCGYEINVFDDDTQSTFESICCTHTHVQPALDEKRFDEAVDLAMSKTFANADVPKLRQVLTDHYGNNVQLPPAQAALLALRQILPSVARSVRVTAQKIYDS